MIVIGLRDERLVGVGIPRHEPKLVGVRARGTGPLDLLGLYHELVEAMGGDPDRVGEVGVVVEGLREALDGVALLATLAPVELMELQDLARDFLSRARFEEGTTRARFYEAILERRTREIWP